MIWGKKIFISLYSISQLMFISETQFVFFELGTEFLNII
jgi:hypothetical protein